MVWVPVARADVVNVASPLAFSATEPAEAGGAVGERDRPRRHRGGAAVTVAVNVTLSPKIEGFSAETSAVDVGARCTTWVSAVLVLAWKAGVPL